MNCSSFRRRQKCFSPGCVVVAITALVVLTGCAPGAVFVTDPATEVYYGGQEAIGRAAREASSPGDRIVHERIETLDGAGDELTRISERHRQSTLLVPAILSDIAFERLSDHDGVVVIIGAEVEAENERFAAVTFSDVDAVEEAASTAASIYRARYDDAVVSADENSNSGDAPAMFLLSDESGSTIRERSDRLHDALKESMPGSESIERRSFFEVPGDDEVRRAIREVGESGASVLIASVGRAGRIIEEESERNNLSVVAAYEIGAGGPKSDAVAAWMGRSLESIFRVAVGLSPGDLAEVELELNTADR